MYDCHVHSIFSHDCKFSMEEMINEAIKNKIKVLYFTDHFELIKESNIYFEFDLEEYWKEVKRFSVKYKNKIDILCGIELGISPNEIDILGKKLDNVPLDMVVLSSHRINGVLFNDTDNFKEMQTLDIYKDYYTNINDLIDEFNNFDVLGHIDVLGKYYNFFCEEVNFEKYRYIIKELLLKLIELDKGLEINTSSYDNNENQTLLQFKILQLYKKLGGKIITIGSDAKNPEKIGYEYKKAIQIAKRAGFDNICFFRKRLPNFVKI